MRVKRGTGWRAIGRSASARGVITGLSRKSRLGLIHYARNLPQLTHILTLTYPAAFPCSGREVKRDWANMRKWIRRTAPEMGGLWFLEFQHRGAPHVHVLLTGGLPYQAVALAWYRIVASGDKRHLGAATSIEMLRTPYAAAAYAAKYAAKAAQKNVPGDFHYVGRMWGRFNIEPPSELIAGKRVEMAPLVRFTRRIRDAKLRQLGRRRRRDSGALGFTAYGVADGVRQLLDERRA